MIDYEKNMSIEPFWKSLKMDGSLLDCVVNSTILIADC